VARDRGRPDDGRGRHRYAPAPIEPEARRAAMNLATVIATAVVVAAGLAANTIQLTTD
jgi:hypothetical protein